ncbi:putative molybdenum carrier protein [Desulfatiglans anilini]|uniref:putative molybdenum carrier protein n=1 Tax=Desulfatiglans anilini TaxID=90728 RepID=UPI00042579E8|nr:putative molybdenum carrier protein [Desulfatiglans anilini]
MLLKIVSGGQTGVDRAALDVAIEWDIPHGGWVPKGRKAEDGVIPMHYQVREMPTDCYADRTEQNVRDSDGTLILSRGDLEGGSRLTLDLALRHERPVLHVDLARQNAFQAAQAIQTFIRRHGIRTLNVAGSRASKDPEIYDLARKVLKAALYLDLVESAGAGPRADGPASVEEAVKRLAADLSLKDRIEIAHMPESGLSGLDDTLGEYIRERFGLRSGNLALLEACRRMAGRDVLLEEDASALIIRRLWGHLKETHRLRVIK